MLTDMRKFTKTWVSAILFGLIIVSFGLFGLNNVSNWSMGRGDAVAQVGKANISAQLYADTFKRALDRVSKQAGRPVTAQEAAAEGVDQQLLQQLVDEQTVLEMARNLRLIASDAQVAAELKVIPAFRDPIKEAFDPETYKRVLAENGLTPAFFETRLREDITRRQLLSALAMGIHAPKAYGERRAAFMFEARDADYVVIDPGVVGAPPQPTDADLAAFLKANADKFKTPERRSLSYILFRTEDFIADVSVPEDKIKELYAYQKDKLSTPEKRVLTVWSVKSQADGEALAKRLKAGESPKSVAKTLKLNPPAHFAETVKAQLADAKLAEAAFSAAANSVVGPVKGDLGLVVVSVGAVTPGKLVTYEEARAGLRDAIAKEMASDKLFEVVQAFQDARDKGASFDEAAAKVKAKIEKLEGVDAQGRVANGQVAAAAMIQPELVQTAFELTAKGESDIKDVKGGGVYYVVRTDIITPSKVPALAEIKNPLTQVWRMDKLRAALNARAEAISKAVAGGKTLAEVAKEQGLQLRKAEGLRRADAMGKPVPPLLESIFRAQPKDVVVGLAGQLAVGVAQVTRVTAPDPKLLTADQGDAAQLDFALAGDLGDQFMAASRKKLKVKLYPERAAKAVGLEVPKAADKPAKK